MGRKSQNRLVLKIFVLLLLLFAGTDFVFGWPSADQWFPVLRSSIYIQDVSGDANGSRDVVGDANNPAAYIFNDGTYIYFRLRLNEDPSGGGGQGLLQPFGWGVLFDTDLNAANYEWMLMVDGIAKTEIIELWHNTVQGTPGSPSDSAEVLTYSIPVSGNIQISLANTSFSGNADYFLDWRFPYDVLKQYIGLTDTSPLRMFFGTSNSSNSLSSDLVGASDLYSGFSDYVTPFGARPTTGTVRFVSDMAGNGDVTEEYIGNTLYIRVDDGDQNFNSIVLNTVQVVLSIPGGDTETLTLTETGVNTGIFTGSILLTYGPPTQEDGVFKAEVGATITATYIDEIDANLLLNQLRMDTLLVRGPIITVTKTAVPTAVAAGGTVTYTITIDNTAGTGSAYLIQVDDTIPTSFTYITDSTSGITTSNPVVSGQLLTWTDSWTIPAGESRDMVFQAQAGSISGTFYNNVVVSGMNFPVFYTGDTAPVGVGMPATITLLKTTDRDTAVPGDEILYTIHYKNTGQGTAVNLIIVDTVPFNTAYVAGSLRKGTAGSTYSTATQIITDLQDADEGHIIGSTVFFSIPSVVQDDGIPDSGDDEGKLYFKVKVD
jgi:uncharacterized repeat protein (TIGR01451 family)